MSNTIAILDVSSDLPTSAGSPGIPDPEGANTQCFRLLIADSIAGMCL